MSAPPDPRQWVKRPSTIPVQRRVQVVEAAFFCLGVAMVMLAVAAYDIRAAVALLGVAIILLTIDIPRRRP